MYISENEGFHSVRISSARTGLPNQIAIWLTQKYAGLTDLPRIRISNVRGKFLMNDSFTVIINTCEIVDGTPRDFSVTELNAIVDWIKINRNLLIDFWYSEDMDSFETLDLVKQIH